MKPLYISVKRHYDKHVIECEHNNLHLKINTYLPFKIRRNFFKINQIFKTEKTRFIYFL